MFAPEDETTIATLAGDSRFIANATEELGAEEASTLRYETFATVPVGSADGTIWGVLTVDAERTGQLVERRDVPLMNVFAAMIGVTYACEAYTKPRTK